MGNSGPLGGATNNPIIDSGTQCLQASPLPCPLGIAQSAAPLYVKSPFLIGKAEREPGKNFDGTVAEDILYADKPVQSASIMKDEMFTKTDAQLNVYMINLLESVSVGDMETVALEMQSRFFKAEGGVYTSNTLNKEIASNSAFVEYHNKFLSLFQARLKEARYDPNKMAIITMSLLNFSSFWDQALGLGITIHQVWSAKAELINYKADYSTGYWQCELDYTFYDHFGLDWADVEKNGKRIFPLYHTGDGFKAWYILQHYRSARPFIVEMKRPVYLAGKLN